jgi:outer membrane protein assembly factor BamD (BamD/ComL family)
MNDSEQTQILDRVKAKIRVSLLAGQAVDLTSEESTAFVGLLMRETRELDQLNQHLYRAAEEAYKALDVTKPLGPHQRGQLRLILGAALQESQEYVEDLTSEPAEFICPVMGQA